MKRALVGRRYSFIILVAIACTFAGCKKSRGADASTNFPSEPLTLIVGSGAGGGIDTAARGIQPYLAKALGDATVIVEDRPGNNSLIAANHVLSSKPDGYHLLVGTNATILNSQLHPDAWKSDKESVDAFIPIYSWMHEDGNGIAVKKGSPFNTMDALAAEAHKRPVKLCISGGLGSTDHVTALTIRKVYGGDWVIVPMDGGAEANAAVLGGNCDASSTSPAGASVDPAQLNMLAVSTKKRAARFPDTPTFEEIGKPQVTLHFIIGAMAPLGTPQPVIDKLEAAFDKARNDPGFIEWAKRTNQPIGDEGWNGKQFDAALRDAYANLQSIIPEMKAELQKAQQGN